MSVALDDRFWSKVTVTPCCWLWTRGVGSHGYGEFNLSGTPLLVHRLSYEALVGPIPKNMTIDHGCRVPRCVNPDHLEVVTRGVNGMRAIQFRLHTLTCPNGHVYTPENTYVRASGSRQCRKCRNLAVQRSKNKARLSGVSGGRLLEV